MIDGIPWQTIGGAGLGWALAGAMLYGLISGKWFVTRREADMYVQRAEKAETAMAKVNDQNAELIATARLSAVSVAGLRSAHAAGSSTIRPPVAGEAT